jgi:ribosomal protein S18 acetylase RimI-like enzyme
VLEDTPLGDGKRWVVVAPPHGRGAALLLARAATPEQAAHVGDQTGGRVALIWDIAVDPPFRHRSVGRRLIAQAVARARGRGLTGVMLETQNINVAACRLYASCGFVLGGFDACLYRGGMPGAREIALFWYLLF